MNSIDWNMVLLGLLYAFFAVAGIQVLYYLVFFSRFIFVKKKKANDGNTQPVSVIICAKNELENLQKNLPSILEQNYPQYEVIVINDNSQDGSNDFLSHLKIQYPHLKVIDILQESRTFKGKRLALGLGLKGAKYDWCLLTDADCAPAGSNWLYQMQRNFKPNKEIVLGYAPYYKKSGFLNKCIRFETFFTAFQYINFSLSGLPYMGVGRNMAYRQKLYFDNKGYISTSNTVSGDDDLFINKVATGKNTSVEIDASTFMYSEPKTNWTSWMHQKSRHISTGKKYKSGHQFLLGLQTLTHFLFYILFVVLLCFKFQWLFVLIAFGVRFLIQAIDFAVSMRKLKEADLFWLFPLFDVLLLVYHIALIPSMIKKPNTQWR
jgi:cellulose synthase/poly-beta-1,6-N-acetylglucosamine synthase-like glycosyltransferase